MDLSRKSKSFLKAILQGAYRKEQKSFPFLPVPSLAVSKGKHRNCPALLIP